MADARSPSKGCLTASSGLRHSKWVLLSELFARDAPLLVEGALQHHGMLRRNVVARLPLVKQISGFRHAVSATARL